MNRTTVSVLAIWIAALAAFFVAARPAAVAAVEYRADPPLAGWVAAVAEGEARSSQSDIRPVAPGSREDLAIGRLADGANVAATRLIVAAWQGSPAESIAAPERLASWHDAVRDGRVRFALPAPGSPLGKDFVALAGRLGPTAEADFYRGQDPQHLRDRDDLYVEDFRNFGPGRWDAGIFYEDAALQINKLRADQTVSPLLRMTYLEGAPDVAYLAEGSDTGNRLIAALVAPAGQRLALDYGIRPLDPAAASPTSLFDRFSFLGARLK